MSRAQEERTLNVLLVEDDAVDVMNVERAFQHSGLASHLYKAATGLEALEILRSDRIPDDRRLILLDLNLPKMPGIEFLRELRRDPHLKALPVVVLTTSDDEGDKLRAYDLNVAGYIVKPVTFMKFAEAMATLSSYWRLMEMPRARSEPGACSSYSW